jgi:hypothetical protein
LGTYKVDFNAIKSPTQYFTIKGTSMDLEKNSEVEYLGANAGTMSNIIPTSTTSKRVNAGVLDYSSTDLKLSFNTTGTILAITSPSVTPKEQLIATILPTFFDSIKAPTDGMVRNTSNASVVTVTTTGQLEGKVHGTAVVTLTIKDLYGNTAQTSINVTVQNKIPVTCDIEYHPSTATNQQVVATLTGCNKSITVTNTGASVHFTFTGNGSFTFTFVDSYGNTGSKVATVTRIDKVKPTGSITYSTT